MKAKKIIPMQKIITKVAVLLSLVSIVAIYSCEKERTGLDKGELYEIYATKPDAFLNAMERDIDSAIVAVFNAVEREELLITRIENLGTERGESELLRQFFNEFRLAYGKSFFEATNEEQEDFSRHFLFRLNQPGYRNCLWPDLGCTSLPENGCDASPSTFSYAQQKTPVVSNVVDHDCRRSTGSDDCDNSYYWEAVPNVYANPSAYNFHWYCTDVVYRAIMGEMVGGFKDVHSPRFGTFLGNRHELAMLLAWSLSTCRQDRWIEATRFYAIAKTVRPRD